jgi:hypothetical protein
MGTPQPKFAFKKQVRSGPADLQQDVIFLSEGVQEDQLSDIMKIPDEEGIFRKRVMHPPRRLFSQNRAFKGVPQKLVGVKGRPRSAGVDGIDHKGAQEEVSESHGIPKHHGLLDASDRLREGEVGRVDESQKPGAQEPVFSEDFFEIFFEDFKIVP